MIKLDKLAFNASVFEGAPLYASTIATSVTVINKETGLLASLWEDREGLIVKANPFTLDEAGVIEFYADAGRYDITAVNGPSTRQWKDYVLVSEEGPVGTGLVDSVQPGDGVDVNSSDPANPVVSSNFNTGSETASYTLSLSKTNEWTEISGPGGITITVPLESTVNLGNKFINVISNLSSGDVTISGAVGVTVIAPAGGTLVIPQSGTAGIKKSSVFADTFIIFGNMVAA